MKVRANCCWLDGENAKCSELLIECHGCAVTKLTEKRNPSRTNAHVSFFLVDDGRSDGALGSTSLSVEQVGRWLCRQVQNCTFMLHGAHCANG